MPKIHSCLCYANDAEEAVRFYTTVFQHYKTKRVAYYGPDTSERTGRISGSILSVEFELEDHNFIAINGPDYEFSSALSYLVNCESEEEVTKLWERLSEQGSVLMALDKYEWSEKYGWCTDRYGVSWQVMLAPVTQKITPSFLFVNELFGRGEEAMKFYTSIFPDSRIDNLYRDPKTNTVMWANFYLDSQQFVLMENVGDEHEQKMTPAISLVVNCKDQDEIDYYWAKLSDGGRTDRCGWLVDKFGVSWQVVPEFLGMMVTSHDQQQTDRVLGAVMGMTKLDIAGLNDACRC
jgi:predicted 3-demethylubiquinone-9 3-methyltransferase (glyoxalase superfamily)